MTPFAIVLGLLGLAWGVAADRIAARWPEHLPGGPDGPDADGAPEADTDAVAVAAAPAAAAAAADHAAPASAPARPVANPPPTRRPDWRTVVVAVVGGVSPA